MDIVVQSLFVYAFTGLSLYWFCKSGDKQKKWGYVVLGLIIYAFIFGLRFGVGRDYASYLDLYNDYLRQGEGERNYEIGFDALSKILAFVGAPHWFFFGFIAFLQVFFVFKTFKTEPYIWPLLVAAFFLNCEWLNFANVIRQSLAFAFFSYSLVYADRRKWFYHYLLVLLAVSMHTSAIVLVVVYPLYQLRRDFFRKVPVQIFLFIIAVGLSQVSLVQRVMVYLELLLSYTPYYSYLNGEFAVHLDREVSVGAGFVIGVLINAIIVLHSGEIKKYFKSNKITFIYNMYYIGTLFNYAFFSSRIIQRMMFYFYGFAFVMGAFTLFYFKKKHNYLMFLTLLALYFLIFVGYMYKMGSNDVAFRFIWQQ